LFYIPLAFALITAAKAVELSVKIPANRCFSCIFFSFPEECLSRAVGLEDHLGGDGTFLVEHGIGECLIDDGPDTSWDTEAQVKDSLDGLFFEQRFIVNSSGILTRY